MLRKFLLRRKINRKFKVERDLLKGKYDPKTGQTSIIHFSVNKAATQYVKSILRKVALENNMIPVHMHHYAFLSGLPYFDSLSKEEMDEYKHVFRTKGYVYSVFGGFIGNIDQINEYKVLLTIRDPRDIVVSAYYSFGISHGIPFDEKKSQDFMQLRENAQKLSIDDFALYYAQEVLETYIKYIDGFKENGIIPRVIRYEEMVSDYETWLTSIEDACSLNMSDSLKSELLKEKSTRRNQQEDTNSHRRKGIAGDYLEKLEAQTIEELNLKFKPVLDYFNY